MNIRRGMVLCLFSVCMAGCGTSTHVRELEVTTVVSPPKVVEPVIQPPSGPSAEEVANAARLWERSKTAEADGDAVGTRRLLRRIVRLTANCTPQPAQSSRCGCSSTVGRGRPRAAGLGICASTRCAAGA